MDSAAEFRAAAAKCRALAKHARDEMTATNLLALARDYEEQAERLAPRAEPAPPMPTPD